MTTGIITILFTGLLAVFYWMEFFPSKYRIKLGLMLVVWLFQMAGSIMFLKQISSNIENFGRVGIWTLGGGLVIISLLYCIGSSTQNKDRNFVKDFVVEDNKIELYHLDRHDHTAIEIFYGKNGLLANRYFKDHFTIKSADLNGEILLVKNSLQAEEIILNVGKMELKFKQVSKQKS